MRLCELRKYMWKEYVQLRMSPKNNFQGFNGIPTRGLCVRGAVLYQLIANRDF